MHRTSVEVTPCGVAEFPVVRINVSNARIHCSRLSILPYESWFVRMTDQVCAEKNRNLKGWTGCKVIINLFISKLYLYILFENFIDLCLSIFVYEHSQNINLLKNMNLLKSAIYNVLGKCSFNFIENWMLCKMCKYNKPRQHMFLKDV